MEKLSSIRKIENRLLIFIVACLIVSPFISHQIILADDLFFHAGRIRSIAMELPYHVPVYMCVDWLENLGSPVLIFYPSLFLYVPAIFLIAGLSLTTVYNGFLAATVFLTAVISFIGFKKFFDDDSATVITAIYISQAYFLFDLYNRVAVGEVFGMMLLPLAFAEFRYFLKHSTNIFEPIIIFSCIIESHVLTTVILIATIFMFIVWNFRSVSWNQIIKIFIGSTLINAGFIIPFVHQYFTVDVWIKYIEMPQISLEPLFKLIIPVGIFTVIAGIFLIRDKFFWLICSAGILTLLFSTDLIHSQTIEHIFQFQWRLLMLYSISSSICLGLILMKIRRKLLIFSICLSFTVMNWSQINFHKIQLDETLQDRLNYIDYTYHDLTIEQFLKWQDGTDKIVDDRIRKIYVADGKTVIEFESDGSNLTLPILFYEGYEVTDSAGHILQIQPSSKHLIMVEVGSADKIFVDYVGLPIYKVSAVISLLTFVFLWRRYESTE